MNAPPLKVGEDPYRSAFDWATGEWAFTGPIHKIEEGFRGTQEAKDLMAALVAAQNAYYLALREYGWTRRKELTCPSCGRLPEQKP